MSFSYSNSSRFLEGWVILTPQSPHSFKNSSRNRVNRQCNILERILFMIFNIVKIVKKQFEIMAFVGKERFKNGEYICVICTNSVIFSTLVDRKGSSVITPVS